VRLRLIAIDIDGTLLDSRGLLPAANRRAIHTALDAGLDVVLVTGRSYAFARPVVEAIGRDLPLIASNGTLVRSADRIHFRSVLPRDVARAVLEVTVAHRAHAALVFDRPEAGHVVVESMDWTDPNREGYFQQNHAYISSVRPLEDALTEDPLQVMFNGPLERIVTVRAALDRSPLSVQVELAYTEYAARDFALLDVVDRGCSKATVLLRWARARGVRPAEIMAIGDNLNDQTMLEAVGLPVVVGNAVAALRTGRWTVTATNDDAGVAEAIHRHALGEGRRLPLAPAEVPPSAQETVPFAYRKDVRARLRDHGVLVSNATSPDRVRSFLRDLYNFELRRLRDRCRRGDIPRAALVDGVKALRLRYPLLSEPLPSWLDRPAPSRSDVEPNGPSPASTDRAAGQEE